MPSAFCDDLGEMCRGAKDLYEGSPKSVRGERAKSDSEAQRKSPQKAAHSSLSHSTSAPSAVSSSTSSPSAKDRAAMRRQRMERRAIRGLDDEAKKEIEKVHFAMPQLTLFRLHLTPLTIVFVVEIRASTDCG